jgi:RNA polymerase sigma factor (sigma-70 family)
MLSNAIPRFLDRLRRTELLREGAEQTDGQLLEAFVGRRDARALEALVRRHAPMVWGICRRTLANHHDAEDAFQATFLVLFRRAASIRTRDLLANWLYGVALKTARKARQMAGKRSVREQQMSPMPEPPAVESRDCAFGAEQLRLLDEELSRLPEKYRVAIVLCDLEGRSRPEAARQLRKPEGTVASRLARGRAMLARRLTRRGLDVSASSAAAVWSQQASGALPEALLTRTIKAAGLLAAGQAVTAGLISTKVPALASDVLRAMAAPKWIAAGIVLLLAALALGAGIVIRHALLSPPSSPEPRTEVATVRGPDPDPGPDPNEYGTAAGARSFARTYLLDEINNQLGDHPIVSPCWPSRAIDATFDLTTHQWTVTGVYRREVDAGLMVSDTYYSHLYAGKKPAWKPQEKGWQSWEKDWKLVLTFNPSARAFEVKKAEGVERLEEGFQLRDGKLVEGKGCRLARTDDFGKWLQGKFLKPKASAAPVTALRLVLDVPELAQFGLESEYSYENNEMDIDSDSRGVRISIDDHGAGARVKRWTLHFGAAPGHCLKAGEYGGAYYLADVLDRPAPLIEVDSAPGFQRGSPQSFAGEFVVREIELQDNRVVRLAIDFITDTGYGRPSTDKRGGIKDGVDGWAARSIIRGSLRHNSQFEPSIPELDRDAAE